MVILIPAFIVSLALAIRWNMRRSRAERLTWSSIARRLALGCFYGLWIGLAVALTTTALFWNAFRDVSAGRPAHHFRVIEATPPTNESAPWRYELESDMEAKWLEPGYEISWDAFHWPWLDYHLMIWPFAISWAFVSLIVPAIMNPRMAPSQLDKGAPPAASA